MQDEQKTIITIKEMRELLGKEYADLSDRKVESVIFEVELMSEIAIKHIKKHLLVPKST